MWRSSDSIFDCLDPDRLSGEEIDALRNLLRPSAFDRRDEGRPWGRPSQSSLYPSAAVKGDQPSDCWQFSVPTSLSTNHRIAPANWRLPRDVASGGRRRPGE